MTETERKILIKAGAMRKAQRNHSRNTVLRAATQKQKSYIGRRDWIYQPNTFYSDFYEYLRTSVPIVGNAIAVWVDLCTAGKTIEFVGGTTTEREKARQVIDELEKKVYEYRFSNTNGLDAIEAIFFQTLFTLGRFAAEIVYKASGKEIDKVVLIDPYSIQFKRNNGKIDIYQQTDTEEIKLNASTIHYTAFEPTHKNPYGQSMLDSIKWVLEIKNKLLEDMARSAHNAGFPRLHVSVTPGEPLPGESTSDYIARLNSDFDAVIDAFDDIDIDDNIFTRDNVNIEVISAFTRTRFAWTTSFEKVVEDTVTGMRLFPWTLGLSHGTTRNWVTAQHDLLMQRVYRYAQYGIAFMDRLRNTELALHGLDVKTVQSIESVRDPGLYNFERAQQLKQERILTLVEKGYISQDKAKQMLNIKEE